jgi:hypothetical protein
VVLRELLDWEISSCNVLGGLQGFPRGRFLGLWMESSPPEFPVSLSYVIQFHSLNFRLYAGDLYIYAMSA